MIDESIYAITKGREYMFNGRAYYPFECDDGWRDLLIDLAKTIAEIDVNKVFRVDQVKEKFGTLRFYWHTLGDTGEGVVDRLEALVDAAEQKSGSICEVCGKEGKLFGKSWVRTLCPRHQAEEEERIIRVAAKMAATPVKVRYVARKAT